MLLLTWILNFQLWVVLINIVYLGIHCSMSNYLNIQTCGWFVGHSMLESRIYGINNTVYISDTEEDIWNYVVIPYTRL